MSLLTEWIPLFHHWTPIGIETPTSLFFLSYFDFIEYELWMEVFWVVNPRMKIGISRVKKGIYLL